jgi:hypothetical protein
VCTATLSILIQKSIASSKNNQKSSEIDTHSHLRKLEAATFQRGGSGPYSNVGGSVSLPKSIVNKKEGLEGTIGSLTTKASSETSPSGYVQ